MSPTQLLPIINDECVYGLLKYITIRTCCWVLSGIPVERKVRNVFTYVWFIAISVLLCANIRACRLTPFKFSGSPQRPIFIVFYVTNAFIVYVEMSWTGGGLQGNVIRYREVVCAGGQPLQYFYCLFRKYKTNRTINFYWRIKLRTH